MHPLPLTGFPSMMAIPGWWNAGYPAPETPFVMPAMTPVPAEGSTPAAAAPPSAEPAASSDTQFQATTTSESDG